MSRSLHYGDPRVAIRAPLEERLAFIRVTYAILSTAVAGFGMLSLILVQSGIGEAIARSMSGRWLLMIGGLMLVAWIANAMAAPQRSQGVQIMGLGIYVLGEAVFFSPIFWILGNVPQFAGILGPAVVVTGLMFAAISFYVFTTRKDFSFMGGALRLLAFAALGLILVAFMFPGLQLGAWFSIAMIVLASGFVLYDTSNVLHRYRTDQAFGAALSLFASLMLLFWYVIRLFMASRR